MTEIEKLQLFLTTERAQLAVLESDLIEIEEHLIGVRDYDVAIRIRNARLHALRVAVEVLHDAQTKED